MSMQIFKKMRTFELNAESARYFSEKPCQGEKQKMFCFSGI